MAVFKNDPFPGTNYNDYLSWQKVTLPSGETYYVVPNHPGYVFDPVASNATGRKVFRANPSQQITDQQKAQDQADAAAKQQKYLASPTGQLVPVGASIGGLWAANHFLNGAPSASSAVVDAATKGAATSGAAAQGASTAGQVATPVATPTFADAATQGATGAAVPVGTAADGSTMMSDGTTAPAGTNWAGIAQGVGGGLQVIQGVNQFQHGDKVGGGLGVAAGGANIGAAAGLSSVAPIAAPLTAAHGLYGTYNAFEHDDVRGGALSGAEAGAGIGTMILPGVGTAIGAGAGLIIGGLGTKFFGHETTRQVAQKHTKDLQGQGADDPAWQSYVNNVRAGYNAPPPDPSKPFHGGQYGSWDEYKTAGLDASDLAGVYGNLNTYGPEWAHLTPAQQVAITQANINDGLYDSKKGEVIISDQQKALDNKAKVLGGAVMPNNQKPAVAPAVAPVTKPITQPVQSSPTMLAPGPTGPIPINQNPDPGFSFANAAAKGAVKPGPWSYTGRG